MQKPREYVPDNLNYDQNTKNCPNLPRSPLHCEAAQIICLRWHKTSLTSPTHDAAPASQRCQITDYTQTFETEF